MTSAAIYRPSCYGRLQSKPDRERVSPSCTRCVRCSARVPNLPVTHFRHLPSAQERRRARCPLQAMACTRGPYLRHAANPRNYEVWYTYATGYYPALNQQINATLKAKGSISEPDLIQIYESYLSSTRLTERIDEVGSQVKSEIDQVMAMIESVAGTASSYTESLAGATEQLAHSKDHDGLCVIVENLVQTTKVMERSNQQLEERLVASKKEINELQVSLEAVRTESLTDPLT